MMFEKTRSKIWNSQHMKRFSPAHGAQEARVRVRNMEEHSPKRKKSLQWARPTPSDSTAAQRLPSGLGENHSGPLLAAAPAQVGSITSRGGRHCPPM